MTQTIIINGVEIEIKEGAVLKVTKDGQIDIATDSPNIDTPTSLDVINVEPISEEVIDIEEEVEKEVVEMEEEEAELKQICFRCDPLIVDTLDKMFRGYKATSSRKVFKADFLERIMVKGIESVGAPLPQEYKPKSI